MKAFTARRILRRFAEESVRGETPDRRPLAFLEMPDLDPRYRDDPVIAKTSNDNCDIIVSFQRIPPAIRTIWTKQTRYIQQWQTIFLEYTRLIFATSSVRIEKYINLRAIVNIVFQSFPGLFCVVVAICCGVKWYWASSRQILCSCAKTARCSQASDEASISRGSLRRRRTSRRHSGGKSDHWGCCCSSGCNGSRSLWSWISM